MAEQTLPQPRILLQVGRKKDRRLIEELLSRLYEVVTLPPLDRFEEPFDLAILDGRSLRHLHVQIKAQRKLEEPVLLPFLLLTVRRVGVFPARHLGRVVDDIIFRPVNREELISRVANLLRLRRLSLDLKKEHDRVMRLSVTDDVSGFYNTRYLHRYLDRLLSTPSAKQENVSLAFFDLDNFKHVVDTHGHLLGAKVLREVAQLVNRWLDGDDRLVRYGGDEFIIILPRQNRKQVLAKVKKMKRAITTASFLDKEGINARLSASFGLATFPHDARDKRELLAKADQCLFHSKTTGKNQITLAQSAPVEEPTELKLVGAA